MSAPASFPSKRVLLGTLVAGLLLPNGIAHARLGAWKRGAGWAIGLATAGFGLALACVYVDGRAPLLVMCGAVLALHLAQVADALRTARRDLPRLAWRWVAVFGVVSAVLAIGTRKSLPLRPWRTPSTSMMPTIAVGDVLFSVVDGLPPRRGELIVFDVPDRPAAQGIKRVVGLRGDVVEERDGALLVNGWEVPRCDLGTVTLDLGEERWTGSVVMEFLDDAAYLLTFTEGAGGKDGRWEVSRGEVWVLGDRRTESADSRSWSGGKGAGIVVHPKLGRLRGRWAGPTGRPVHSFSRTTPELPDAFASLRPAFERCLAERPTADRTRVPPP